MLNRFTWEVTKLTTEQHAGGRLVMWNKPFSANQISNLRETMKQKNKCVMDIKKIEQLSSLSLIQR